MEEASFARTAPLVKEAPSPNAVHVEEAALDLLAETAFLRMYLHL